MALKYPADVVGRSVVNTYYRSIIKNKETPWCMSYCYRDESSMVRIDGERVETASGLEQIEKFVMFPNVSKIEIRTTHSIDSIEGGVLVVVNGFLHTTDNLARRKFMQTFFFSRGHYIISDKLQFLEEEEHMNRVCEDPNIAEFSIPPPPAA